MPERPQHPAPRDKLESRMSRAFGFTPDELKLLLVAVRQTRRTFAEPRRKDPALEAYAALYDDLFEKLREMAGPLPAQVEDVLSEAE
jgi:hypothetical protein